MAKKSFSIDNLKRSREQVVNPRQPIYELSTTQPIHLDDVLPLPPEAAALSAPLRELALRYIRSRRRVGEALLEACRAMTEARNLAEEGEWLLFLSVMGVSPDQAEVQINIYLRSQQYPAFAEKLRSGWLNQSVAGELARASTPPEVLNQLLEAPSPPKVADVRRARRNFKREEAAEPVDKPVLVAYPHMGEVHHNPVDKPVLVAYPHMGEEEQPGVILGSQGEAEATLGTMLNEVAEHLEWILTQESVPHDPATQALLQRIEQATQALWLRMRG
ncbi:hypothetical protein [Candidatus Oscillochloris fontis]|uniref:hypothetical protein n=1 Tax=Candidatus Oscillochloris fontis TaxID=2496868 RepID=UPI00101C408C|nr:hypothetical protein [Candidatus Oscillochloris fontis]